MSKSQRDKGRRGELEAGEFLSERGVDVEFDHGQAAHGGVDMMTSFGGCEVKRRARQFGLLYEALDQEGCVMVMHRDDRRGWLVTMRADLAVEALQSHLESLQSLDEALAEADLGTDQ